MKRTQTIEVVLTPKEVQEIITTHLRGVHGLDITRVDFKVGKIYSDNNDEYGRDGLTGVNCYEEKILK